MQATLTHTAAPSRFQPPRWMTETVRRMLVTSLLGCLHHANDDVAFVQRAVEANVRDPAGYRLYLALLKGIAGDGSMAAELLAQKPHDDATKVLLAQAMKKGGHEGWRSAVDEVLALSVDVDARQHATALRDAA